MKAIQVFVLIGFCTAAILIRTVLSVKEEDEKSPTDFITNLTNELYALHNRSFLEANKHGFSTEKFANLSTEIPTQLKDIKNILDGIKLADYPKVPTPIDVFSEKDNNTELPENLKNSEDFLWGIHHEVDSFVKSIIERANKMETELNESAKNEKITSILKSSSKVYCNLREEAPRIAYCMCHYDYMYYYSEYDCFHIMDDWTKDLRRSVTEGIQKIIDKMYKFPGDLNAFSPKPNNDSNLLYGILFVMRHMHSLDEAYDDLKNQLNRIESKAQEDSIIKNHCATNLPGMSGILTFEGMVKSCLELELE